MIKKRGPKPGTHYGKNLSCPYCERTGIASDGGLSGHIQMSHSEKWQEWLDNRDMPGVGAQSSTEVPISNLKARRVAVEEKELEIKELKVETDLEAAKARVTRPQHIPDVAEKAGLGPLRDPVASELQSRLLNLEGSQKQPKWWEKALGNMSAAEVIAMGRGILNVGQGSNSNADPITQLRNLLSLSNEIRGLFGGGQGTVPVLPEDIILPNGTKVPKGTPATESVLQLFVGQGSQDALAMTANRFIDTITPALTEWISSKQFDRGAVASQPAEPQEHIIEAACSECGASHSITTRGVGPGSKVHFTCKSCGEENELEAYIPGKEAKPSLQRKPGQTEPDLDDKIQCSCGQLLQIPPGKGIGDTLLCPVCQTEVTVMSEDMPIMASEPQIDAATLYQRNQDIQRRQ